MAIADVFIGYAAIKNIANWLKFNLNKVLTNPAR